jgi:hypothetical protein
LHDAIARGGRRAEATVLPTWVKPQLTKLLDQPPEGPESLHEINSMSTGCMRGSIGAWSGC